MCNSQDLRRVKLRYGGTDNVPPGATLRNVALSAGLKIPVIFDNAPLPTNHHTTTTPTTTPATSTSQTIVPPHVVQPEMRSDCCNDMKKEELLSGKVAPLYEKKVGALLKLFEERTKPDEKTTKGRQPPYLDRKTSYNVNNTRKNKSDIQCDPVSTDENICDENFKFIVSDIRRQPLDVLTVLKNSEMHDLPADDITVEQLSCTASVKVTYLKENALSQRKGIELPLQPSSPSPRTAKDVNTDDFCATQPCDRDVVTSSRCNNTALTLSLSIGATKTKLPNFSDGCSFSL